MERVVRDRVDGCQRAEPGVYGAPRRPAATQAGRFGLAVVAVATLLVACAPLGVPGGGGPGAATDASARSTPKRLVAAIMSDPGSLATGMGGQGGAPGIDALEELVSAGLANVDNAGRLRPQLAEAVPSLDNGLWRVLPDGRMESTWAIRQTARWHDGVPFTAQDVVFAATVWQDRDLPISRDPVYDAIERVEAPDQYTVMVRWRQPFIEADTMFTHLRSLPLPRHLLEHTYLESKPTFAQVPYWTDEFVGTGPYRVSSWVRGSHLVLQANDAYVLGRPKIAEIEVKFIPDAETLVTNVLADTVDLTMGRGPGVEHAVQLREHWRSGRVELVYGTWSQLYPQFLNPSPAIVGDARFRRALLMAINRQEIADTLMAGLVPVAHSYLAPTEPEYAATASYVVRYPYDPNRAAQAIQELGYTRGPDGGFRDDEGQRLSVEIRTTEDSNPKGMLAIADYWQRIGVATDPVAIPASRARDREYRANFPAFQLLNQPNDPASLRFLHGSAARLPPDYAGRNQARYMNPAFDSLLDTYFSTIRPQERTRVLGQVVQHISEQLPVMGLFYNVQSAAIASKLRNVGRGHSNATHAWNAEAWDSE